MVLPEDIVPEKSMYVMGARILDILKNDYRSILDPISIYDRYIQLYPEIKVSYNYFLYALDWLFILNTIELTGNDKIKKCF